MGNCLRHESSMEWGGEDWGSPAADFHRGRSKNDMSFMMDLEEDEQGLFLKNHHDDHNVVTSKSGTNYYVNNNSDNSNYVGKTTEVKIKITKKQLEELLGKDMTVQQVLTQLINVSNNSYQSQHLRSWRPALQSIPEVN